MKINHPLVSIIMPVYNAGDYLVEAIRSILKQTYDNFELIIVNDASSDKSLKIIRKYKKLYPQKIKLINLKRNLNRGGDACANLGFAKAKGKFIARMDADDVAHPERIEKQVDYLLANPDVLMVGSHAAIINKKGEIIGEKRVPLTHDEIYKNYFITHPMIHPSIMINKKNLPKRDRLYTIKYDANNDYLTFFEFLKYGRFANIDEKLINYRLHGKNDSLTHVKSRFINSLKIRWVAFSKYGYEPTAKAMLALIGQIFVVFLLPEKLSILIYMIVRGIYKPESILKFNFIPAFSRIKRYALSLL